VELLEELNLTGARIAGNPDAKVRKVFFCEYIIENRFEGIDRDSGALKEVEEGGFNALISFEIVDWTLSEYVRDAAQLGQDIASLRWATSMWRRPQ